MGMVEGDKGEGGRERRRKGHEREMRENGSVGTWEEEKG